MNTIFTRLSSRPVIFMGVLLLVAIIGIFVGFTLSKPNTIQSPLTLLGELPRARIYDPYSFDSLKKRSFLGSKITLERQLGTEESFTSYLFSFRSDGKKVTGQANIPTSQPPSGGFPVIVQIRGYVDHEIYKTGVGTAPSAAIYAKNGFITLAPDFLGYGESDPASNDSLLDRFENPIVVLNLLSSISTLPQTDPHNVFLWGHSNGGQIAISVLEISRKSLPTTLWAPVTKPFPYSILYYTDKYPDRGKYLRKLVADFENVGYDADRYSITTFLDNIKAPLQFHQGSDDEDIPLRWSDDFVKDMKDRGKNITYYVYPGVDHNLHGGWDTVVARDLAFFRSYLR